MTTWHQRYWVGYEHGKDVLFVSDGLVALSPARRQELKREAPWGGGTSELAGYSDALAERDPLVQRGDIEP